MRSCGLEVVYYISFYCCIKITIKLAVLNNTYSLAPDIIDQKSSEMDWFSAQGITKLKLDDEGLSSSLEALGRYMLLSSFRLLAELFSRSCKSKVPILTVFQGPFWAATSCLHFWPCDLFHIWNWLQRTALMLNPYHTSLSLTSLSLTFRLGFKRLMFRLGSPRQSTYLKVN